MYSFLRSPRIPSWTTNLIRIIRQAARAEIDGATVENIDNDEVEYLEQRANDLREVRFPRRVHYLV